jgi:16S rRNA (uracil1498-N3)-methyltransferase
MPMSRRRFFVPQTQIQNGTAVLPLDQAHHLRDVLRLRAGDEIELFDGAGNQYVGKVKLSQSEVTVHSLRALAAVPQSETPLVLASALIKSDRFEWILQKGTELGVSEFIPLKTRYCGIKIPDVKIDSRLKRWDRIVLDAARQSGAVFIPRIRTPLSFTDFVKRGEIKTVRKYLLYERAPTRWRSEKIQGNPILLCVGPEGGWHPQEVEAASQAGFQIFSLGTRILRAETAALAAVALIQFQAGAI